MPGTISLPWEKLLTDGVRMSDEKETRARFEAAGTEWNGSGVTACIPRLGHGPRRQTRLGSL